MSLAAKAFSKVQTAPAKFFPLNEKRSVRGRYAQVLKLLSRTFLKAGTNPAGTLLLIESFLALREEPMRPWLSIPVFVFSLCLPLVVTAQIDEAIKKADDVIERRDLSDGKIISGLKEALEVSTTRAVALTGRHDGFMKNEAIRILLPPKLQAVGKGMRLLGMGEQVDDLEIGMNRAAEQATPQAKQIFLASLKKMNFTDARRILTGNDTAATDYFRRSCSTDLAAAFTPVVHRSLQRVGVVQQYDHVIKNAPGGNVLAGEFDLDQYVVEKTLDGIFYTLGGEESKIRKNPGAQTTELLREVFGSK